MNYLEQFQKVIEEQLARVSAMDADANFIDYGTLDKTIIGLIAGDGIGPVIMDETVRVLNHVFAEEISKGKVELRNIEGLTIENRVATMETVPTDVLAKIKECHILLKGPTMTPDKNSGLPNLESANVKLRKELDLFANVRPVAIPELGIDWTFYRENTEGEYALGSKGVQVNDDISVDFKVTTTAGTKRIAKAAFEFAKANGKNRVSIVTKANILKKTDGKFLDLCYEVAKDYPEITADDWYIDIMSANLLKPQVRSGYQVFVLPNLYGDIITDEAAQIQGGVGTAGSANIGSRYAMFEAIHGSAPRMIERGMGHLANPASLIKASEMMLRHMHMADKADRLSAALDYANENTTMSGREGSNTAAEFSDLVISKY